MNTKHEIKAIDLSKEVLNTLVLRLSSDLVREDLCTPPESLGIAVAFAESLEFLMIDPAEWQRRLIGTLSTTWVNNEPLKALPVLDFYTELGYVSKFKEEDGAVTISTGRKIIDIVLNTKESRPPLPANVEITKYNRIRGYGRTEVSDINKEAIHILEATKFQKSEWSLEVIRSAWRRADVKQMERLKTLQYVFTGTAKMEEGKPYISEFNFDDRGRMGQVNCAGPSGSGSDEARACMDLHGVKTNYNIATTLNHLIEEIEDMIKCKKENLDSYIEEAVSDPAGFYLKHIKIKGRPLSIVSKPLNFCKFADLITKLRNGERPYIGVAIGLDAKCSGPQLGGLMIADDKILTACGFTTKEVDDAYERAIKFCLRNGITGMTRSGIKKAFMAIFYGAGAKSMCNYSTIEQEAYEILYSELPEQDKEGVGERFHQAIVLSFGAKLNRLRRAILDAGLITMKDQPTICKYNKPVKYLMPDGFQVATDERARINADGIEFIDDKDNADVTVFCNNNFRTFEKPTWKLKDISLGEYARKGFVNMIQASDAQLARLIILHVNRLGAQHIVSIHDCFRVNIHDVAILEMAIQEAYLEMFGGVVNEPTRYLQDTDILSSYFKGSDEACSEEYKGFQNKYSQFYSNGRRVLHNIDGVKFTTLVRQLGKTKYFAK